MSATPLAFHVMLKPAGARCNLACAYCYYLKKADFYPGAGVCMSDETLERFTRQYLASQQVPQVTFGWQGGEPLLMGLAFFRRAVELQHTYRPQGKHIINTIQTNGTLLNAEWCQFFREQGFLVGISLDGPAAQHDAYRVDKAGNSTHARVMAGLRLLQKWGVEYNILTTVHAANATHPLEVYRFLRDEAGGKFLQFIPIVECEGSGRVSKRSVTARLYGNFLNEIFDEWVRHDVSRVFVQIFDVALAATMGERTGVCIHEATCGQAMVLEHNGDLYACDHFVDREHRLGNIWQSELADMAVCEEQVQFGKAKEDTLPRLCLECSVRFVCRGGCPKDRIRRTPAGQEGLNYLCQGYRSFFTHVERPMKRMAALLRQGRAPAEVMSK